MKRVLLLLLAGVLSAALKDYQPEEVGKLDGAILDRQGTTVLLAVPASHDLAQAALDALR